MLTTCAFVSRRIVPERQAHQLEYAARRGRDLDALDAHAERVVEFLGGLVRLAQRGFELAPAAGFVDDSVQDHSSPLFLCVVSGSEKFGHWVPFSWLSTN
jgi:hypothetical protein